MSDLRNSVDLRKSRGYVNDEENGVLTVYIIYTYPHMAVSWEVTANVQSGLVSVKYTILEEKPHKRIIFTWVNDQLISDLSLNTGVDLFNI